MNYKVRSLTGTLTLLILLLTVFACKPRELTVTYNFNRIPDRIWIGEDFWTVPVEDWQVKSGRIECISDIQNASFSILPYVLGKRKADFRISVNMGLLAEGTNNGSTGISLDVEAREEKDIRAAVYFGSGINMGINTEGYAFLGMVTKTLPDNFDFSEFNIEVKGKYSSGTLTLEMALSDKDGNRVVDLSMKPDSEVSGIIQLKNNMQTGKSAIDGPKFWFDDLVVEGSKFENRPENRFGPVFWTMYTLSNNVLKLSAQLPPVGEADSKIVELQLLDKGKWTSVASGVIEEDARNITFKIKEWDSQKESNYRVSYDYINSKGENQVAQYDGIIQKEPSDRPLRFGALTCQFHYGFPYSPLVKNLKLSKPDILYFSGDQIYEQNGGYPIKRQPEDMAILNYLGKWYMFGWAFGDLMRNIPTICTPDDHDVFHGNLWGEEGMAAPEGPTKGFVQTVRFVDVVNHTNCAHLPDPYDPTPIDQGMSVWYTSLNYGRVSFAIISDRIFKSSPTRVATWETRPDHILKPPEDPKTIDKPELEMLGKRQERFLEEWIREWKDVDMKVLLSQTLFANVATHHGTWDGYVYGDMDSGGWPKTPRDRALRIMRKGFVFHIAGDQHVPSFTQYGIDNYRDAGWCFINPAITVGYSRWFRPDELKIPVSNRPAHGLPNTGEYKDAFGNLNYVYAIGNPGNYSNVSNRYELAQIKSSGFGMVIFNTADRNITIESWRFLADVTNPDTDDQHPGWPVTISQFDNYGREARAWLPTLKINGDPDPVVEVINQTTGETEYMVRIKGNEFIPKVFSEDIFTIQVGYPETGLMKNFENLKPLSVMGQKTLDIEF